MSVVVESGSGHSLLVGDKGIAARHGLDRTTHDKVDQVQLLQGEISRRVVVMLERGENGVEIKHSHLVKVLANVPNSGLARRLGLSAVDDDADDVGVVVGGGIGSPYLVVRRMIGRVGHEDDEIAEIVEKLRQRMVVKTLGDQFDPRFRTATVVLVVVVVMMGIGSLGKAATPLHEQQMTPAADGGGIQEFHPPRDAAIDGSD
jgi:hypothetical protein